MERKVVTSKVDENGVYKWIELIKKHKNIKKLDKETLNELISKIYVHEKEVVDGEITQIINTLQFHRKYRQLTGQLQSLIMHKTTNGRRGHCPYRS